MLKKTCLIFVLFFLAISTTSAIAQEIEIKDTYKIGDTVQLAEDERYLGVVISDSIWHNVNGIGVEFYWIIMIALDEKSKPVRGRFFYQVVQESLLYPIVYVDGKIHYLTKDQKKTRPYKDK